MVAAAPAAAAAVHKNPSTASRSRDSPPNQLRRPLTPSEKDNATASRRPRTKEIGSRYLSTYSSSSLSTTSTSFFSNNTTSSSRRFLSPLPSHRPSTPSTLSHGAAAKRSLSVDRTRPSTPRSDPRGGGTAAFSEASNAARSLCTTTRSLSVSFQGESFFYQTSKAKNASPAPSRKPTPERRRSIAPARSCDSGTTDKSEIPRPSDLHHRWPAARNRQSNMLTKSLDCSADKDFLATVQLLRRSILFEGGTTVRASFDGADPSTSSDTESVSSGSNSGAPELIVAPVARASSGGISVPARFWQETNSRTPLSTSGPRNSATPKIASVRRSLVDGPSWSPRSSSSPLRGPVRPSSPSKLAGSPSRRMASPSRARCTDTLAESSSGNIPVNAPSILSFAAEVRRSKKGENRIEEAHALRMLHNRQLQWRCVNARINTALMVQRVDGERSLYNVWMTISELHDSVTLQKMKLHFLSQYFKLSTILKGQMLYLEEWFHLDREHLSSLSGAIAVLKAITLRLPVANGAKADFQEVKDAVGSAIDVMQAMGASMRFLLSKAEGTGSLVSELANIAAQEQVFLDQSRDVLSTIAALHVKQFSLWGHLLQLKRNSTQI
ncbi:hypothetical protein AXF42_Ash009144 [Apostasia shenzhenica]|uniref:QWRF motif-containing protein 2 n=1 Tax=Apostasia shenzhenica TaxID=1088818 RepID=A0A2I0ADL8_9ASPA|nr:hypothetical protein AXF42_Ash009144 [Apostasia shenzhenica]